MSQIFFNPDENREADEGTFRGLDLMTLKSRGYNVDRILRAKAAEARLAEEQRVKQFETEKRALEEQEKRYQQSQSQSQLQQAPISRPAEQRKIEEEKAPMPGSFAESPKLAPPPLQQMPERPKSNIFDRISRHLGLEEQMQNLLNNNNTQPQRAKTPLPIEAGPIPIAGSAKPDVGKATEPHRIQANLQRAIEASRGHNSDSLFSPPQTFDVKEAPSYCDNQYEPLLAIPNSTAETNRWEFCSMGQDILYFADTPNGIKVFIDRKIENKAAIGERYVKQMSEFSNVLKELSGIFGLAISTLHIYYDEAGVWLKIDPHRLSYSLLTGILGNTIAFNTNGSLFCNLRYAFSLRKHL